MKRITIEQYPEIIKGYEKQILDWEKTQRGHIEAIALIDYEIDQQVAFEEGLRNETQRKAKREELRKDSRRAQVLRKLENCKDKIAELEIEKHFHRNEFSILKLRLRESVVKMEANLA